MKLALLAQLAEQRIDNTQAAGSSPAECTIYAPADDEDDGENSNGNEYLKRRPLYMTFKKRAMKNLHYLI